MTLRTITFDDEQWQVVPKIPTDAMQRAGGHVNSEWLNDNAPIGEKVFGMPMPSVHAAMLAVAPEPPAQQPIRSITLTGAQIRDLAEFVGLGPMRFSPGRLELETEVEISGPGDISDEAGKSTWFPLVACIAEYPEDGYIGLGDPLPAAGIGKGEINEA